MLGFDNKCKLNASFSIPMPCSPLGQSCVPDLSSEGKGCVPDLSSEGKGGPGNALTDKLLIIN